MVLRECSYCAEWGLFVRSEAFGAWNDLAAGKTEVFGNVLVRAGVAGDNLELALVNDTHERLVLLTEHLQETEVVGEAVTSNDQVGTNVALHTENGFVVVLVVGLLNESLSGFEDFGIGTRLRTFKREMSERLCEDKMELTGNAGKVRMVQLVGGFAAALTVSVRLGDFTIGLLSSLKSFG